MSLRLPRRPARALALVLMAGCAGSPSPKRTAVPASATPPDETPEPPIPPARGHQVASLDRRALGPFTSHDAAGGLVAWAVARNRGEGQDLVVVPTAPDGAAMRGAQAVAQLPSEATSLIVQRTGGKQRGWLVAWSALLDRGESLSVLGVAPDGSARGAPTDVQRTSDHVKWAALIPTSRGALCLWAEQTAMNDANLFANALEPDGKARGMPVRIAQGVVGWQALPANDGAALALVSPVPLGASDRGQERPRGPAVAGTLSWMRLDADGHAMGNPTVVAGHPTVGSDVDVVARDGGWLLAWTDRTGENSEIMTASVDDGGAVKGPAPALPDVGGSSLVGLASGSSGALVAWVEPHGRKHVEQDLGLALVPPGALAAQPLSALRVASTPMPEVVGSGQGFGLLASARVCKAVDGAGRPCAGPLLPTFVRLGPHLDAVQTEPLFVGPGGTEPAAVAWQLQCLDDGRCTALAAPGDAPTPVYAMDLSQRTSPFAPPLPPALPPDAPRVTGIATVASGAPFEDVAAAHVGESTVLAALAPTPDARPVGGVARVSLRAIDGAGRPLGPARTMSSHAVPVGGIAMATAAGADDGAVLAWVARDDGDTAVHLARIDRAAHATREVRLSSAKSEASDVAVAWVGDGWVVAWVDARDGNGEVYAAKVDRDLKRVGRDERITSAPGDAGGVTLATAGDLVWAAWSDPRDNPRDGLADIFVATLRAKDAAPTGHEVRVLATAAHSRSPQLVAVEGGGAIVGWIEEAPTGLEGPGAALIARLEPGPVVAPAVPLPLAPGERPSSITFVPEPGGARVLVAHPMADILTLDALRVDAGGRVTSRATHLLDLDAPPVFEPSLALVPGALFYVDVGLPGGERSSHRIRRAAVSWSR